MPDKEGVLGAQDEHMRAGEEPTESTELNGETPFADIDQLQQLIDVGERRLTVELGRLGGLLPSPHVLILSAQYALLVRQPQAPPWLSSSLLGSHRTPTGGEV